MNTVPVLSHGTNQLGPQAPKRNIRSSTALEWLCLI